MYYPGLIDTARVLRLPMLVLGAAQDILIPPAFVRATARSYGTEAEIFPDMAHGLMLERDWEAVARRIRDWLAAEGLYTRNRLGRLQHGIASCGERVYQYVSSSVVAV